MADWHVYLKMLSSLIAIVNPLLAVPMFITLTADQDLHTRHSVARRVAVAVAMVLSVTALIGTDILQFFGVSMAAFRVGGGILLLLMAIAMMHAQMSGARHTSAESEEAQAKLDVAIVPLAIPLLAGPGAISTVIIYANQNNPWQHTILLGLGLLVAGLVWGVLRAAIPISRALGTTGINIATRIMGLLLAAIAIEFITRGLVELLPGLA